MATLKRTSKKVLISLINQYEQDIMDLQEQMQNMSLSTKYITIDSTEEDAKNIYIKKRMMCARNTQVYIREYARIMKERGKIND